MSENKMGGVPSKTRDALYQLFEEMDDKDDSDWAKAIEKMTKLGPKKSLKRLKG